MNPIRTTLGSLTCHVVQRDPKEQPDLIVVLCHGYGAPGSDLVPLAEEILGRQPLARARIRFVFPEAPLALPELGFSGARAWWPLDVERLVSAQLGDESARQRYQQETPDGLSHSRRLLIRLVEELSRHAGVPISRVMLGGFSQGAMLATDVALRLEESPAGLVILSGTLICEPDWRRCAPIRKGLPVLQTHGSQDPLLPFARAEALRELLSTAGLTVEFVPFDGPHTIPTLGLTRLAGFIADRLGAAPRDSR